MRPSCGCGRQSWPSGSARPRRQRCAACAWNAPRRLPSAAATRHAATAQMRIRTAVPSAGSQSAAGSGFFTLKQLHVTMRGGGPPEGRHIYCTAAFDALSVIFLRPPSNSCSRRDRTCAGWSSALCRAGPFMILNNWEMHARVLRGGDLVQASVLTATC